MRRFPVIAAAAATLALVLAGCAISATQPATDQPSGATVALSGNVTVSAAASLKGAFDTAIEKFTAAHPDVHITASYDGSSTLATQIIGGAKVDVFASADQANMDKVTAPGLASDPVVFARNTLVIVVPKGNSAGVQSLADLAKRGVTTVLCAPEVPCGAASRTLLDNAGVSVTPASSEQNVTAVLTKVRTDEADAGLVYKTDAATAAGQVETIVPEGADKVVNSYPIAVLKDAPDRAAAQAFVDFITGTEGQAVLASFGFEKP
ncbi:molybdate ABC transporter substrate-binding protein [Microbacterium elymi]|uniref:Molybdate ABC transporter substrate-binding protein n=1 Tax=Microbacterium elymi TaxID=2909587 RepID=A0ABY5NID8_9MICO|nr:molybdate ABC transporter substrate-binding protein [Microbacterium elymi]UUT34930.1 molybdate ABC transporter substrate-binding protein [Microbacterium elymi]